MRFETRASGLRALLSLILLFSGSALAASDDLFFVPIGAGNISIPFSELLANDPPGSGLVSWEAPTRGSLTLEAKVFEYQPGNTFWSAGIDRFRYTVYYSGVIGAQASIATYTAYILADDHAIQVDEDFETGEIDMSFFVLEDPAGAMSVSSESPVNGDWSLRVDLDLPGISTLRNGRPSDPRCDGKIGHGLDGGAARSVGASSSVVIDRALGIAGEILYEASFQRTPLGASELCLLAREDGGSFRASRCVAVPEGAMWLTIGWRRNQALPWETPDGLLYLLVDGELHALLGNLDNWESELAYWQIGAVEKKGSIEGVVLFDDLTYYVSPRGPSTP